MDTITQSNRYLIYKLLGRKVTFKPDGPARKTKPFDGVVERVTRDIFDNSVVVTVSGKSHSFKEPTAILEDEDNLVFVYGDLDGFDDSDESLFREIRSSAYADCINDILDRRAPVGMNTMRFRIGPKVAERRAWTRRNPVTA